MQDARKPSMKDGGPDGCWGGQNKSLRGHPMHRKKTEEVRKKLMDQKDKEETKGEKFKEEHEKEDRKMQEDQKKMSKSTTSSWRGVKEDEKIREKEEKEEVKKWRREK